MSLNPSDMIAEAMNPGRKMFPNLAKHREDVDSFAEVDQQVKAELIEAGIKANGPHEFLRKRGEVPTAYLGELCRWGFARSWHYWVATGPGIPTDKVEEFHSLWGRQCRVDGHCGCPSPLEWFEGFAVGHYHIDTQEGLNAFAALLRSIHRPAKED